MQSTQGSCKQPMKIEQELLLANESLAAQSLIDTEIGVTNFE